MSMPLHVHLRWLPERKLINTSQLTLAILKSKEQNRHTVYTRLKFTSQFPHQDARLSFGWLCRHVEIHGVYITILRTTKNADKQQCEINSTAFNTAL